MSDTRDRLLDAAEKRMRTGGYHAISFRDLADDLAIKSASVHYHFRQKEDLGVALIERYSDRFFELVDELQAAGMPRLEAFANAYRNAYTTERTTCLCGLLGAESPGLPPRVADAVQGFLDRNLDWLVSAFPEDISAGERRKTAIHVLASLQGGMMLAVSLDDPSMLDAIVNGLRPE